MITDKATYHYYLKRDLAAYELTRLSFYNYWWMDALRFQMRLRKIEYLHNTKRENIFYKIQLLFLEFINHQLSTRLGFTIPKNVFSAGLCIVHHGTTLVSQKAKNRRELPDSSFNLYR
jgi:serine acetyltransferase